MKLITLHITQNSWNGNEHNEDIKIEPSYKKEIDNAQLKATPILELKYNYITSDNETPSERALFLFTT